MDWGGLCYLLIFVLGGFWFGGFVFIGAIVFIYRTKDIFCVEGYDFLRRGVVFVEKFLLRGYLFQNDISV